MYCVQFRRMSLLTVLNKHCYYNMALSGNIFTTLHGMQTRSYDEISVRPSVRPSVCLSVKRVHCDKTEESYV